MADGGEFLPTLSIIITVVGATGTLSWWLASQFRDVRNLVYNKTEQLQNFLLTKMDAHEKHDDKRFEDLNDDLWDVRIRLAAAHLNGHGRKKRKNDVIRE